MPYIYKSGLQFGINETNIYGGAEYVELTQAEYDALSDAEKHNGQIYFITDGNYDFLIVNDSVPIGSIQAYGGTTAPNGWLICDGSAVSRTDYKELFQAIGISFGEGDGDTTFNIPDLRGRITIGNGLGTASDAVNRIIGQTGGNEKVTLSVNQLPSHVHKFNRQQWYGSDTQTTTSTGSIYSWKTTTGGSTFYGYQGGNDQYGPTGGGQAHDNMQPYVTTNYIIKAKNPSVASGQQLQAMELFYPVGSYFETSNSTFDPNVEWGGTWVSTGANIYEEKKLLWTNSNPTAAFNAQTLSLDLTAYNYVEIGARWMATYDGTTKYQKFSIGNSYGAYLVIPVGANDGVSDAQRYNSIRAITINTNGIVFKSGGYYRWSATDQGSSESYAVPIKIFGIKELTQYKWKRTA